MMTIAVIYGGTRKESNTEILAENIVRGISAERIYLRNYNIQPIEDLRHAEGGFHPINDDYNSIIDRIMSNNILLFVTPIYWYSMSGIMKNFIDRWSQTLRDARYPGFKEALEIKKAFVIAAGGDQPHFKGLPMIQQFQYIFDFIGISFEGYIIGNGNKPGDIHEDKEAQCAAAELNKKLQTFVKLQEQSNES